MENYEFIQKIGTGSFGSVSKIRRKSDNKILVWKEINYGIMSEKEKQQLVAEVNILRELRHPNIVRYYDRVIDRANSKIFIVMEYCEGGDMAAVVKKCKRESDHLPEEVVWKIFMQISLALYECHKRKEGKILHRDLKPANIFLDSNMNVKLGDFGLARIMDSDSEFASTHVGTPYYMSPEQISESRYNEKSDIWSLGCLLYEFAALNPPFEAKTAPALAIKIRAGHFEKLPSLYSDELWRVVVWMLNVDAETRPGVDDLLNMPQVSLRLRERKLRENMNGLKKKEEELKKRESEVEALEEQNRLKRIELESREKKLKLAG